MVKARRFLKNSNIFNTETEIFRTITNFKKALKNTNGFYSLIGLANKQVRDFTKNEKRNLLLIFETISEWMNKRDIEDLQIFNMISFEYETVKSYYNGIYRIPEKIRSEEDLKLLHEIMLYEFMDEIIEKSKNFNYKESRHLWRVEGNDFL